jgi:hypothetical protein
MNKHLSENKLYFNNLNTVESLLVCNFGHNKDAILYKNVKAKFLIFRSRCKNKIIKKKAGIIY